VVNARGRHPKLASVLLCCAVVLALIESASSFAVLAPTVTFNPNPALQGQFVLMNGTGFTGGPSGHWCWNPSTGQLQLPVYYLYKGTFISRHFEVAPGDCASDPSTGKLTGNFTVDPFALNGTYVMVFQISSGTLLATFNVGTTVATATSTTTLTETSLTTRTSTTVSVVSSTIHSNTTTWSVITNSTSVTSTSVSWTQTTIVVTAYSSTRVATTVKYNYTQTSTVAYPVYQSTTINLTSTSWHSANATTTNVATSTTTSWVSFTDPVTDWTLFGLIGLVIVAIVVYWLRSGSL
jgi:hypothetical protein